MVNYWDGQKVDSLLGKMDNLIDAVKPSMSDYDLSDYKDIAKCVRDGNGDKIPNGHVFSVTHAVYGAMDWVVIRKNVDKVVGDAERPTLTIQSKYIISPNAGTSASTFQYDRPEAFYSVETLIPANTVCKFTANAEGQWTAGTYNFTATADIAVGSKLCISGYAYSGALTTMTVDVYTSAKATSKSASYAISSGAGSATLDLGTWATTDCNHAQRVAYGSNNDAQSNIFQWLNGDSGDSYMDSIFVPSTKFDMMSTSYTSLKGFLGGFPADFLACLGLCNIHNITNDVYETGYTTNSQYTHQGYFWLPSRKEIYGSNENANEDSETQFPYYQYVGTENADKLGYAKGATSATTEWLRTPYAGHANRVRIVYAGTGGALNDSGAHGSGGVRPLAIIS